MKRIMLISLVLITLAFTSVAKAASVNVGGRYEVGNFVTVSDSSIGKNTSAFSSANVFELFAEWQFLPWLGAEASGQIGNTAPKIGDYDLSGSGFSEMSAPAVLLKTHFKKSWFDVALGVGGQYNMTNGGKYQTSTTTTVDDWGVDGSGNPVIIGTSTITIDKRYSVAASGMTPLVQLDTMFTIWKGLSLGLDAKYTPLNTTTIDLSKVETSYDGGSTWSTANGASGAKATATNLAQFFASVSYSF